jgi:hypothetical protein
MKWNVWNNNVLCFHFLYIYVTLSLFGLYGHDRRPDRKDRRPNTERPERPNVFWVAFLDDRNLWRPKRPDRANRTDRTPGQNHRRTQRKAMRAGVYSMRWMGRATRAFSARLTRVILSWVVRSEFSLSKGWLFSSGTRPDHVLNA